MATTQPFEAMPPTLDRPEPESTSHWYGWQILLLDAGAVASWILAASSESSDLAIAGAAVYVLGGPVVHGSHGETGRAFGSLGLRVGLPIGGAFVGAGTSDGEDSLGGAVAGFGLGMLAAMLIDSTALAHERIEKPRSQRRARVTPTLRVSKKAVGAGLVGSF